LIDVSEWAPDDPVVAFETLRRELSAYDLELTKRPFAVVPTKIDVIGTSERLVQLQTYCRLNDYPCLPISAAANRGLDDLVTYLGKQVERLRKTPCETSS
jgi:GTP-binding protein